MAKGKEKVKRNRFWYAYCEFSLDELEDRERLISASSSSSAKLKINPKKYVRCLNHNCFIEINKRSQR